MRSSKGLKIGLIVVLALVVLAGAGFWWFFIRDDAPPEASLVDRPTADGSSPGRSGEELDGAWAVAEGDDTFAGFRISEHFPGFDNTTVVRTGVVDGSLTVDGVEITEVELTVDLTELESLDAQPPGVPGIENRLDQMRNDGLETERFPTATFALTSPIVLDAEPEVGETVNAVAEGDLTLHGETRAVSIPVEARWNGEVIDVAGSLEVALADHGMTPPTRSFVSVDEVGTMEFQLTFVPA